MTKNSFNNEVFDNNGYGTIEQARRYFKVSRATIVRWANQCGARYGSGRLVRININKLSNAFEAGELK